MSFPCTLIVCASHHKTQEVRTHARLFIFILFYPPYQNCQHAGLRTKQQLGQKFVEHIFFGGGGEFSLIIGKRALES